MRIYGFSGKFGRWLLMEKSGDGVVVIDSHTHKGRLLFNQRQKLEKVAVTPEMEEIIKTQLDQSKDAV